MRKAQRWRYYCDHRRKASGSAVLMQRHELGCTANPNRACGYCGRTGPVAELVAVLGSAGRELRSGMTALRLQTQDCPGYILAAMARRTLPQRECPHAPQ